MRRLLQILLNAATLLSMLLCIATAALWVRSYFVSDWVARQAFENEGDQCYWTQDHILSGRGGFGMFRIVQAEGLMTRSGKPTRVEFAERYGYIPFHRTHPPLYPSFPVGDRGTRVWGGFKRGGFLLPDPDGRRRPRRYAWQWVAPYWAVVPPLALLPAVWSWRAVRRRRRSRQGMCQTCGYDLRATPERCPECGAVPSAQAARPGGAGG
jgi:hypothetical protein